MTRQTPSWSKMSGMDSVDLEKFQMSGQDIPWLLEHWADRKPDHPVLVWAPREGGGRHWTYAELLGDVRRVAAGLDARGIAKGDKVLIHAENCPEMVLAWLACATLGAVAVTTNTKSVGAELTYFAEHTGAVAAITQPQYAAMVAEAAPALKWIVVTADNSGEPASDESRARLRDLRRAFSADADWTARAVPSRCCRSGSCSPRAPPADRRPSSTPTPTRSGRAAPARATSTSPPTTPT